MTGVALPSETPPALRIVGVMKRYGSFVAVRDLSLEVGKGEFLTLLGPSGCGKTTTLRLIAGVERADAGRIEIDGVAVERKPSYKRDVATVFQSGALFPHLTVGENVGYGLKVRNVAAGEARARVEQMLDVVRMGAFVDRYPASLSGGQRQRIALARSLAVNPSVLLFDEPMSALDLKLKLELRAELRRLHGELGFTAIYVTHDQGEAMALSDRVAVLNKGGVEEIAPPTVLYENPATEFVYTFVGESCCLTLDHTCGADAGLKLSGPAIQTAGRLYLRPNQLSVVAPGAAENEVRSTVSSVEYVGGAYRIHAETPFGLLFLDAPGGARPCEGEIVTIGWRTADARFFARP